MVVYSGYAVLRALILAIWETRHLMAVILLGTTLVYVYRFGNPILEPLWEWLLKG